MAEAVFANPDLRAEFELMVKRTSEREPVPDDFAWLARDGDEFSRFKDLTRKLLTVPKSAIDAARSKRR